MAQQDNTGYQIAAIVLAFMLGVAAIVWANHSAHETKPCPMQTKGMNA